MTSSVVYDGMLRTTAIHLASNTTIHTDAPTDNHGKGEYFSPTDLVATALGSCMFTIMGIVASRHDWNLQGMKADIKKIMATEPRRIGAIEIEVYLPASLADLTEKDRQILENAALTCPVYESLHADCLKKINFHWPI